MGVASLVRAKSEGPRTVHSQSANHTENSSGYSLQKLDMKCLKLKGLTDIKEIPLLSGKKY